MSSTALIRLIAASGMFISAASATCQASNEGGSGVETNDKLCLGQGAGSWTFAMDTSESCVPAMADGGFAGCADASPFYIFDESCNIRGTYSVPDCGAPFIIEENFLADVLTVTSINLDVGAGYFSFLYGDGKYSIRNNHCGCQDDSSGLTGGQACKCAFPVDGHYVG